MPLSREPLFWSERCSTPSKLVPKSLQGLRAAKKTGFPPYFEGKPASFAVGKVTVLSYGRRMRKILSPEASSVEVVTV